MELVKSNDSEDISQMKIYGCPECGSSIEIESIKDGNITYSCFKCNNKNKFIPIKDFLRKMENFNSTFNNCNYCNKKENNQVNWKYCLSHKITLCDICINKHKNENGNECNLIENNKKLFSCQFHSNEENKSFCKVCKTHLCAKCLKDEKIKELHRGHHKDHFDDELTIYDKEKEKPEPKPEPLPYEEVVPAPEPEPQPKPVAPIREDDGDYRLVRFQFFGTDGEVRLPKGPDFKINGRN